jgi:hypothetical protein
MRDLACNPANLAGPVDNRVVNSLSKRYPIDADFLACMASCHGGQSAIGTVAVNGRLYRVAEFLTLLDDKSNLTGDFRPHFDHTNTEERVVRSIPFVIDCDGNTSRCLFSGLVPFAATQKDMSLDRGYVDLFCFDYRIRPTSPAVVIWDANRAMDAYFERDSLPFEQQFGDDDQFLNVNWDSFLIPVASSFQEFVEMLRPTLHDKWITPDAKIAGAFPPFKPVSLFNVV